VFCEGIQPRKYLRNLSVLRVYFTYYWKVVKGTGREIGNWEFWKDKGRNVIGGKENRGNEEN